MEALEELYDLLMEHPKQQKSIIQLSTKLPLESIFPQPSLSSHLTPTEQKIYLQLVIEFQIILNKAFSYHEGIYRWNLILDDRLQCYGLTREAWEHIAAKGDQDKLLQLQLHRLIQKITNVMIGEENDGNLREIHSRIEEIRT